MIPKRYTALIILSLFFLFSSPTISTAVEAGKGKSLIPPESKTLLDALRARDPFRREFGFMLMKQLRHHESSEIGLSPLTPDLIEMLDENTILWLQSQHDRLRVGDFVREFLDDLEGGQLVAPLVDALDHERWQIRADAVQLLGKIDAPRSKEAILSTLNDCAWQVRLSAVVALEGMKGPRLQLALVEVIEDPNPFVRAAARNATNHPISDRIAPGDIHSRDWRERLFALAHLNANRPLGNAIQEKELVPFFHDPDWMLRFMSLDWFADVQSPEIKSTLAALAENDENAWVRCAALEALAGYETSAVKPLKAALADDSPMVRTEAALQLAKIGDPAAIDILWELYGGNNVHLREISIAALAQIGTKAATDLVADVIHDSSADEMPRVYAILALDHLQPQVKKLVTLLNGLPQDPSFKVRDAAVHVLGRTKSPDVLPLLEAYLDAPEQRLWPKAIFRINGISGPEATKVLNRALNHKGSRTRLMAASYLLDRNVAPSQATEVLLREALNAEKSEHREMAIRALDRHAGDNVETVLLEALDDPSYKVRQTALRALGRHGTESSLDDLVAHLDSHGTAMRQTAALALFDRGAASSLTPLESALRDEDEMVRMAAALAIARITAGGDDPAYAGALGQLRDMIAKTMSSKRK